MHLGLRPILKWVSFQGEALAKDQRLQRRWQRAMLARFLWSLRSDQASTLKSLERSIFQVKSDRVVTNSKFKLSLEIHTTALISLKSEPFYPRMLKFPHLTKSQSSCLASPCSRKVFFHPFTETACHSKKARNPTSWMLCGRLQSCRSRPMMQLIQRRGLQ